MTKSGSSKRSSRRVPFPERLFRLLKLAEDNGWEDIISWVDDGEGFKIHDKEKFEDLLLAKYFNTTRYASFTRQLHAYGFDCLRTGRHTGICKFFILKSLRYAMLPLLQWASPGDLNFCLLYFFEDSHPDFTRDDPEAAYSLIRETSKSSSKKAISTVSKNKSKVQGFPVASLKRGIRAGDTIVQFPTILSPQHDYPSSISDTSDSESSLLAGFNNTFRSQVAERTRRTLIRIPPEAPDNPFNNPDKAFWTIATSHRPTVSDVVSLPTANNKQQEQQGRLFLPSRKLPMWSSPTITNMANTAPATISTDLFKLYGMDTIQDNAIDPVPLGEKDGDDENVVGFDDLEPIPWSPEHDSPDNDEGQGMSSMDQSNQLDSVLEPRSIQEMVWNPEISNEWWYDSAPMFGTPRKRAVLEFSLPLSLPLGFYLMDVSKFGICWVIFLVGGHFVECLFTDWGGSEDKNDKTYTKDLNIKPKIGMLQHHILDLLWFHFLLSNMILTPKYFGPPCFPLLYMFMWPQPINLMIVVKTHYCESNLEGTYAHEKYWIGDIIKKSMLGYAMTMLGVIPMHLLEMHYLRVPLVFGFNMIPLLVFESYRCMLAISAVNGDGTEKMKVE